MDADTTHPDVVVAGSLNVDEMVGVAHIPRPGETLLGEDVIESVGGKGANQAVAAARLGRCVAGIGLVGSDDAGATVRRRLSDEGVRVDAIGTVQRIPTGKAFVFFDGSGENTIVVSPGANAWLRSATVREARELLANAPVVTIQMEIPDEAITEVVRLAGGMVILNPAPARAVPVEVLQRVDVLVPNRSELGVLAGEPEPRTPAQAQEPAQQLGQQLARGRSGPAAVVVTLGDEGALLVHDGNATHCPAPEVPVVDSTGAGDAFCGALADALVRGLTLEAAVARAVRAAALTVSAVGAQAAMPTAEQLAGFSVPGQG